MENHVKQIAKRIKELRLIIGKTPEEMAEITGTGVKYYTDCEEGKNDFSFTFLHNCAKTFGVDITELLSGESANLATYTICRSGEGMPLERRKGFNYRHLASKFRGRMSDPFLVTAKYEEDELNKPLALSIHEGEEFDYILDGSLEISIGGHTDILHAGDSIYYNSREEHGMRAVGGRDCLFLAMVTDPTGMSRQWTYPNKFIEINKPAKSEEIDSPAREIISPFVECDEDENGRLLNIRFKNKDKFNFTRDFSDKMAEKAGDKLAMLYVGKDHSEKRFTFEDIRRETAKSANYFASLGIKKGDRVMLVLKRHYQFWFSILALQRMGAVAVPATDLLMQKDFEYRFENAGIRAILCTSDGIASQEAEKAFSSSPGVEIKVIVGSPRDGWRDYNAEHQAFSDKFVPKEESEGDELALMYFSSGTTGYPKIAMHSHTYALGHYITAKYWHNVKPGGLHFTIADTGWGKALWGKLYGQWMCGCAVMVYDFDKFRAEDILPMFKRYNITTFCAPPTMYRFFIKEDLSKYDLSVLEYATTAGEALNPEVFNKFYEATGLKIMEGFGQTETTLTVANLVGMTPKVGSMGLPSPMYDADIFDSEGKSVQDGQTGEIVIRTKPFETCGVFGGYYNVKKPGGIELEKTNEVWHDGVYHTGDMAWRDEDGYFWYVGRIDDLIKSSGYRIGPFEIESVIMELPYVLECAVTGAPDEIRGQIVKATIVLTNGSVGDDALKKEIQEYVKKHTAPYKYPRIVEFVSELPKTISGKIRRVEIRNKK